MYTHGCPLSKKRSFALLGLAGLALHHALGPAGARTVRAEEEKAQAGTESVFDLQGRVCRLSNGMSMPILGLGTYTLMNRVAESSVYGADSGLPADRHSRRIRQ